MDTAESSAPKRSTVIPFCLPKRRSTCLTPPAPVSTVDKADEMILQDTLQISRSETSLKLQKSEEQRGLKENVELVKEHLASVEIEKMVDDSLLPRNDEPKIPDTRLEPRSDKESSKVEITNDKEVEINNVVILVNVNEEEEEITDEVYELKRKGEERKFVADLGVEVKRKECSSRIEIKFQNFGVHPNGDQDDPLDDAHPEGENHAKRKEILVSPHPRKTTPLIQSSQRYPEAPPLSLINQDLLYLKKGSSGPQKIVLSLYKFPAIIFNDDDIENELPDG
ncbi:hypothetical protein Tco_0598252 [Tanacetum coccineum]